MRFILVSTVCLFGVLQAAPGFTAAPGEDFSAVVREAVQEGRLTEEEAVLQIFRFAFSPENVRADLHPERAKPLKCLTPAILEFDRLRQAMSPAAAEEIDRYLSGSPLIGKTTAVTYDSPAGLFRLTYETSGQHAPPQTDVDPANGVPDYVEWVATYCDSSWHREIDGLGFNPPALSSGELYPISFQNMGAYGYTMDLGHGRSRIVIENDFYGFPGNQDPEGTQKGAAKVTCAHEFKHASQMNTTGAMAMGGWVELDATWMEDVVYDETNDYYNYLGSGSGISHPDQSLDYGGSGSYEDCIWQHHLCETWGLGMGLALMQRRQAYPSETTTASYAAIIADQGSDFASAFTTYATWNYKSSIYADSTSDGYEEAASYPIPGILKVVEAYPNSHTGSVARMAANFFQCKGMATIDHLRIRFEGTPDTRQRVVALLRLKGTLGGGFIREDVPLDSLNRADYIVSMPGADLKQIAVIVVNGARTGSAAAYSITFENGNIQTSVAGTVPTAFPFDLRPNEPNPFNPQTTIVFSLPSAARASLLVYNSAGRVIRTLLDGEEKAPGAHAVLWDGRDDRGREVASGVYLYRLAAENRTETRKMLLVR